MSTFQGTRGDRRSRVTSFQPSRLSAASMAGHLGKRAASHATTASRSRYLAGRH